MSSLLILFLGVLLGAIFTRLTVPEKLVRVKRRPRVYRKTGPAKQKIMQLLKRRGRATNDDIQRLLDVSDATATRYLESLEREGRIAQSGHTGKWVFYKKR